MGVFRLLGVPKIQQQHDMSCWYAAARMVCGTFVKGPVWGMGSDNIANARLFDNGLNNGQYVSFQRKNNMLPLDDSEDDLMARARSYSKGMPGIAFQTLVLLLDKYGPLWTAIKQGQHAVVLVGMQTLHDDKGQVLFHDPATGAEEAMDYDQFNKYEVQWECKGVIGHYEGMSRAPRLHGVVSISSGLYAIGEIA